jgi:phage shock protein A
MGRFFNWIKALFNRGMDKLEDPDIMLDQARRDMQAALSGNQEKAIQAITQRNQLEKLLQDQQAKSAALEKNAETALKQGDRDTARAFLREKANADANIQGLQVTYDQASKTVESVKTAVQRQREEVQKKTAEALALKAQWKQAQIQNSIAKALDGLTFENQFEGFGAAQEKIRTAQSEAAARSEMQSESLYSKVTAMEDKTKDYEAEDELQKMEARLGLNQPAPAATTTSAATTDQTVAVGGTPATPLDPAKEAALSSEADKQLDELEKRIKGP